MSRLLNLKGLPGKFSSLPGKKGAFFALCLVFSGYVGYAQSKVDSLQHQLELTPADSVKAAILESLGNQHMLVGAISQSLASFQQALAIYESSGDRSRQALVHRRIGEAYQSGDDPKSATKSYMQAVKLFEATEQPAEVATTYNLLVDLFMRQLDFESAMIYSKKVQAILGSSPDQAALAQSYTNLGRIHNNLKQFDSAIYYHRKAAMLFDSLGLYHGKGRALHNMANSLREKGAYAEAIDICNEVLRIRQIDENKKSKTFTILLLADIYNNMGNPKMGIEYGLKGLKLANTYHFPDRARVALLYLSQSYEQLPDYKLAMAYHKRYSELSDSIFNSNKYAEVSRLKALYETEKKESTIATQRASLMAKESAIKLEESKSTQYLIGLIFTLVVVSLVITGYVLKERSNRKLIQQKAQIEKQNAEREMLLKEIHHRVKNNLQVISSLLNMQSRKMADGEARSAVREGQTRIKSMSLIHEKLYGKGSLSKINMKEYIEELSEFLFRSYRPGMSVKRAIEAEALLLDVELAMPLGLIINELISNALKYAFDADLGGEVIVSLQQQAHEYVLQVADTGKGLPDNYAEHKSMGMNLVNLLVEQLEGTLQVHNEQGVCFIIRFPQRHAA